MPHIQINQLILVNFNPKELTADIEISFTENEIKEKVIKNFLLKQPDKILNQILIEVKSKNRILFDDPTLDPVELLNKYAPIIIDNQEQTEEKIFNFTKSLCENALKLKNTKEAAQHMKLLDQFKTASLTL